jgi:hypothetical protein
MIDKKIKYAVQGGGPNYLGKQKMVKAPKKWKSSPDHPDTELAYITEPEKQVLIALNLHGGLEDGKPNRGPSGIISLQGDMGSIGGGSSSGGSSSGGGGGDAREQYIAQQYTRPTPTPTRAPDFVTSYKDPDPVTEVVPGDKTFEPVEKYIPNIGPSLHGDMKEPEETIQKMIARQQEEKYGPLADSTKMGETIDKRTQKEKDEDFERDQDWNLIKEMSDKGYDFKEIQSAINKGLTVKAPTTDRRQNLIDFGLRSIIPETKLEKSLLNRMKSFAPAAKTGISGLTDRMGLSNLFNPRKMFTSYALNKMGLGMLNPIMGLASLFGFKNPFANIGSRYAGVPTKNQPIMGGRGEDAPIENVMQTSIKKFQPTDQQTTQMNEIMRKRMVLQGYADKGALNEKGQNTLAQMNQLISQYQANPRSIYG